MIHHRATDPQQSRERERAGAARRLWVIWTAAALRGTRSPARGIAALLFVASWLIWGGLALPRAPQGPEYLSPVALVAARDGGRLYIAEATARQLAIFDTKLGRAVANVAVPAEPTGLALTADGARLYVTCGQSPAFICVVDTASSRIVRKVAARPGARAPVIDRPGRTLYICNRFDNSVSIIDADHLKEIARVAVSREPHAAAMTADGRRLFVAGHLPEGPANAESVAAKVCVVDTASRKLDRCIDLPNGSTSVHDIAISPDGAYAFVTHLIGRYTVHTAQLEQGWMNTNALSIIDAAGRRLLNAVLLDDVDDGAANPWGLALTTDSKWIFVAHAGTHELSAIDAPALLRKLNQRGVQPAWDELSFLNGIRTRIRLKGKGPRGVAVAGNAVYAAEYFTDSLARINIPPAGQTPAEQIALGGAQPLTARRRGEMYFHDATPCFQRWQSCASCHPDDARADGLNWDLLNDGIGNPKNTRSLLLSHRNPPVMSTGVRPTAEDAVRSGMRHVQLAEPNEAEAADVDEYLKSLEPLASPHLENGKLSKAAERGKELFFSERIGCASCHRPPFYSDGELHRVANEPENWKTPVLIEVWRTAPYFHDGRYATIKDAIAKGNCGASRGAISHLTASQLDDLVQFVLSL